MFALAGKLASGRNVQEHARRYLKMLARGTGETAHLAVMGMGKAIFVDHEFGDHLLAVTTQWGHSEPLHCTAVGKALLAGMDSGELRKALGKGRLRRYTGNTVTRISELARQCKRVGKELVAFDRAEFREGMNCVASPVYDFRGRVVAAIGVSGPKERLDASALEEAAAFVKKCAQTLSAELGWHVKKL